MLDIKKIVFLGSFMIISVQAETVKIIQNSAPHFYLQMENQSDKEASISFQQGVGNVSLTPVLQDHTSLAGHQQSAKYAVTFSPLDPADTFNVIFTGKRDCTFTVGYFAPGNPKISVSGYGCNGGGYRIIDGGYTLLLYVSDVHVS